MKAKTKRRKQLVDEDVKFLNELHELNTVSWPCKVLWATS